ncbi:hypothetical protein GCM10020221_28590 [Streptomyces thioluteus]|uniref:Transposase n=1 Tax=Streptomyces thioluteus TaxID=66431 RepID=A0ABN3WX92_STRTU
MAGGVQSRDDAGSGSSRDCGTVGCVWVGLRVAGGLGCGGCGPSPEWTPAGEPTVRRRAVERTGARFAGCRRPYGCHERRAGHFLAFTGIARALICHRRLTR